MTERVGKHGQVGCVPHKEEDARRLHEGERPGAFHLVGGRIGGGGGHELQRALHVYGEDHGHQGARDPRRGAALARCLFGFLFHRLDYTK